MIANAGFDHAQTLSPELRVAVEAARRGGEVLRRFWQKLKDSQIAEKSRGDLVTAADLAAEETITEFLRAETPELSVVCEEGTEFAGEGAVWYVDPLDGTTNFVQRFPVFAISIGLAETRERARADLLCGLVYNPIAGDVFYGVRGKGAYYNGQRLHVAKKTSLGDAVIATGFPRRFHDELEPYLREFAAIFREVRAIRRAGAASLDLCWTAQGIFDGFWEHRLSPWDIAAGALIVEEAGGMCTDFHGTRAFLVRGDILGAPPALHGQLLSLIRKSHAE